MKDQFYSKLKGQRHELINGDKITSTIHYIGKPLVRINAVASHLCSMLYQPYVILTIHPFPAPELKVKFCPLIINYLDSGIIIQF